MLFFIIVEQELDIKYFQLTTSILLRRAYCTSRPWDQWILLASLKILHGQVTPMLDSVSLHLLQGTSSEKIAECDLNDDAEENADPPLTQEQMKGSKINLEEKNTVVKNVVSDSKNQLEIKHNSPKSNLAGDENLSIKHTPPKKIPHESPLPQANSTPPKDSDITANINTFDCNVESPKGDSTNGSETPVISYVSWKQYSLCKDKSPKKNSDKLLKEFPPNNDGCPAKTSQSGLKKHSPGKDKESREMHHACQKNNTPIKDKIPLEGYVSFKSPKGKAVNQVDVCMQVTPKRLGIYTNKWVQVKLPRRAEQEVQTELFLNSRAPQTKNSSTQTHFQGHGSLSSAFTDKEVQTILIIQKDKSIQVDCKAKTVDHPSPVWKMVSVSGLPRRWKNLTPGSQCKGKYKDGTQKGNNYDTFIESLEGSKVDSDGRKNGWFFHGRPLLNNDEMKPVDIPMDYLASSDDHALLDPRMSDLS